MRGIAVVALAAVASRSGASDIATWSISRAFAGSSSRCSGGTSGSVNHTVDSAKRAADLRDTAHRRRGLARHAGIGFDGGDDGDPRLRAQVEELRREGGVDVGALVEDHEDPRPPMIDPVVGARAQPGDGDQLADHVGGGVFVLDDVTRRDRRRRRAGVRQPLGPRPEALGLPFDDDEDEVLGTVQRDRLEDDRRAHRPHVGERAVQPEHAELGEVDADRAGRHVVVAGDHRRRGLAQVLLTVRLRIDGDLRSDRADPQPGPQELVVAPLPGPQVEGAQRRPAGEIGEVGRLVDPLGPLVEQRLLDLGLALVQPHAELLDRLGELARSALLAVQQLAGHRQRRQQAHHQEHRRAGTWRTSPGHRPAG